MNGKPQIPKQTLYLTSWSPVCDISNMFSEYHRSFPNLMLCRIVCLEKNIQKVKGNGGKASKAQCGFHAFENVTGFSSIVCRYLHRSFQKQLDMSHELQDVRHYEIRGREHTNNCFLQSRDKTEVKECAQKLQDWQGQLIYTNIKSEQWA